jgi:hypothetical protein
MALEQQAGYLAERANAFYAQNQRYPASVAELASAQTSETDNTPPNRSAVPPRKTARHTSATPAKGSSPAHNKSMSAASLKFGKAAVLAYDNPLTGDSEPVLPSIQSVELPRVETIVDARKAVAELYTQLGAGEHLEGEADMDAGTINARSVTVPYANNSSIHVFLIQPGGESGKAMRSGQTGQYYFLASEDGRSIDLKVPYQFHFQRPRMLCIIQSGILPDKLYFLKHANALILGALAFICLILMMSRMKKEHKLILAFVFLLSIVMACVYALESHAP